MSANLSPSTAAAPQQLFICLARGRVSSMRRVKFQDGPRWLSLLVAPAVDEFSSPEVMEVISRERLVAEVGDSWQGRLRLGGRRRSYRAADPETGEQKQVMTADNRATVVE